MLDVAAAPAVQSWWERFPQIFLREVRIAKCERFRPMLRRHPVSGIEHLVVRGRVRVYAARSGEPAQWHAFDADVTYPEDYPFDPLDVTPLDPEIRRGRHQAGPSGLLCYMQEEMEPWAFGSGIERAIEGARDWFEGDVTGVFTNEVPAGELLAYLTPESMHVRGVLIPGHATWEDVPATSGRLVLEWNQFGQRPSLAIVGTRRALATETDPEAVRSTNNRLWRALRLHRNEVKGNKFREVEGLWFRLDKEPAPFHDLPGLEATVVGHTDITGAQFRKLVEQLMSKTARAIGWLPLMLEYPRRLREGVGPEYEWLATVLVWPTLPKSSSMKGHVAPALLWAHIQVRGVPSYSVRREDLGRRVGDAYGGHDLALCRVVIVGVGALGSTVARSLTAMGVGYIGLVDPDIVQPGNVVRHEARFPDVGERKIDSLAQILRETNPGVEVEILPGTRNQHGQFDALLLDPAKRPSLIIATVANQAVDAQVDDVARRTDPPLPVLHAWVMAQAQMLRAFLYRAGATACVYCNGLYERDVRVDSAASHYIVGPLVPDTPFFETSCSSPAFPGAGNANALAAHVVVEMALDELQHRLADEESHWVFAGNRIADVFPELPVSPLSSAKRGFRPHALCPVCSTRELTGDLADDDRDAYRAELANARAST